MCLLFSTVAANAAVQTFTAPVEDDWYGLNGWSQGGFTFSGPWTNYGRDSRNAPFMELYDQAHSITYNGTFTFNSMSLGGWPWDNYGNSGGTVSFDFLDINGAVIDSGSLTLPGDNAFYAYSDTVEGVHSIAFNSYGFWPRLDSINYNGSESVPEPASMLLLSLGLVGLVGFRKKIK
jgi:hypothetical protein